MGVAERVRMRERKVSERIKDFCEVPLGYTLEEAQAEARRCLQCRNAPCVKGCPVEIDIPRFVKLVAEGKILAAARVIKERNLLPAICGRVCPQEEQCEKACTLAKFGEPLAIGALERFVADYEAESGEVQLPEVGKSTGKSVAVVGSGPASLTAASDLRRAGHRVVIYEGLHKAGGVLAYGIPEFRLPKSIVARELELLEALDVELRLDCVVGKLVTLDELLEEHEAVFLGTGAGLPYFLGIEGEDLCGVYSANEFLTRVNLMRAYLFPEYDTPVHVGKNVVVIGGGNTAMDAARTALRLGAGHVKVLYRRTFRQMPARIEEIKRAQEEGIEFTLLAAPVRFLGDEHGNLQAVECIKMQLGEPDASGRARPVPVENSEFTLPADVAIIAVSQKPNPLIPSTTPDLKTDGKGYIIIDPQTGMTSKKGVFAGGDVVSGGTVIKAMGDGRFAARNIDAFLK